MYGGKYESQSNVMRLNLRCVRVGFSIFVYLVFSIVNEWWIARRGMAFGAITSASGASGIVMPLTIEALLNRYGHRTILRAIAIAMVVLTGPLISLVRGRLPLSHISAVTGTDWCFATRSPLPRVFFRKSGARSRVILPIALLALLRRFCRSQRERRRHAARRHECRVSRGPMDLRHTLRQNGLESFSPPLDPRYRTRLLRFMGPRARSRALGCVRAPARLLRVWLLLDAVEDGYGGERGADGCAGQFWHFDFLLGQWEFALRVPLVRVCCLGPSSGIAMAL